MPAPRLSLVHTFALGSLAIAMALIGGGSCQGPDSFLRTGDGAGGTSHLGGSNGQLGGFNGLGGSGAGGSNTGFGGAGQGGAGAGGSGGAGAGGRIGAGGSGAGGRIGAGGSGTGGAGTGGRIGSGGAPGVDGGTDVPGSGGMTGSGGAPGVDGGAGGMIGGTGPCAGLCANPIVIPTKAYNSMALGTGPTCHETTIAIGGGNCGNFVAPRTFTVNGSLMIDCVVGGNWPPLPAPVNGGYCFQASAGGQSFGYFVTF